MLTSLILITTLLFQVSPAYLIIDLAIDVACVDAIPYPTCIVVVTNHEGVSYNVRALIEYPSDMVTVDSVSVTRGIIADMGNGEIKWLVGTQFTISTVATATVVFDRGRRFGPFNIDARVWSTMVGEMDVNQRNNADGARCSLFYSWIGLVER